MLNEKRALTNGIRQAAGYMKRAQIYVRWSARSRQERLQVVYGGKAAPSPDMRTVAFVVGDQKRNWL